MDMPCSQVGGSSNRLAAIVAERRARLLFTVNRTPREVAYDEIMFLIIAPFRYIEPY
jgi:hypothetical protein